MGAKSLFSRQQTSLTAAIGPAQGVNCVATCVIATGGVTYKRGELLTVSGGTALITTLIRVDDIDNAGGIARYHIERPGAYTANPSNAVATTSNGSGTGATFTLTYISNQVPANALWAICQAETQDVRWRDDGTAPTASVGQLLKANDSVILQGSQLFTAKFIETTASAKLNVTVYKN